MERIQHRQNQRGFTLVELMIVVAIIGILAAIAIPQYRDYVARTQLAEAVQLLRATTTVVEDFAFQNGRFPATADLGRSSIQTTGAYTASIAFSDTSSCATAGIVTATIRDDANALIQDKEVLLSRSASGDWSCTKSGSDPIDDRYLPPHCQQSAIDEAALCAS